ncbi:MAG: type II secretion system protein GspM [Halioglobus sp.]
MLENIKTLLVQQQQRSVPSVMAAAAAITALLLLFITTTARHTYDLGRTRYKLAYEDLHWMISQKATIDSIRSTPFRQSNQSEHSLISIVTAAAEEHGLLLSRYKPEGDFDVQLWTEDSPLHATLDWVKDLQNNHHFNVINMSLGRGDKDGFCRLQIELRSNRFGPT